MSGDRHPFIYRKRGIIIGTVETDLSGEELLKYAMAEGIIDLSSVRKQLEMAKREEYLAKHEYKIWQGNDGKWRTYIPDKEKTRRLVKKSTRRDIEDVIIAYYKQEIENPTIDEVFTEWNDRRLALKKISESTHLRNKQYYNRHYSKFGKRKIKSVSEDEWQNFLEEQIPEYNLTSKAFSGLKGVTKGLLKRAKKRKLIAFNIDELFSDLDITETEFKKVIKEDYEEVYNEEESDKIISYLEKNLNTANIGILLMFVTGIRVGELVALKHEDFESNTFKIRRTETRYRDHDGQYVLRIKDFPKSQAGVRTVIVPKDYEWLCNKIKLLNPFGEYIFVNLDTKERLSAQAIRQKLSRLCKKLSIYHKSPHKIRKTYGTILLDNHIDNQLIIGQMGHTNILCTENHYHRNRRTLENKTAILSEIPELKAK